MTLEKKVEELEIHSVNNERHTLIKSTGQRVLVELAAEPLLHEVPMGTPYPEVERQVAVRARHFQADAYIIGTNSLQSGGRMESGAYIKEERDGKSVHNSIHYRNWVYPVSFYFIREIVGEE